MVATSSWCQLIKPCSRVGSVSLALLAGIDAAWSGDWSRIGVISKNTEQFLQSALTAVGGWHLLMGMCAYIIASQNGRPELPATAKVTTCSTVCSDPQMAVAKIGMAAVKPMLKLNLSLKNCVCSGTCSWYSSSPGAYLGDPNWL